MGVIQFKRVLNGHTKGYTYDDIMNKILGLNLADGEPILCSYNHEGSVKYLFAVKVGNAIQSFPMFSSLEEIQTFIQTNSTISDIIDNVSVSSDVVVTTDSEGKLILKIKDNFKNVWIDLSNE